MLCLFLILIFVWSSAALQIRNHTLTFHSFRGDPHQRRLALLDTLVFLNTTIDPVREEGFGGIAHPGIYLVKTRTKSFYRLIQDENATIAIHWPELKYSEDLLNQTILSVSLLGTITHPKCVFQPRRKDETESGALLFRRARSFIANCSEPVVEELALNSLVLMIDSPRIRMTRPIEAMESNSSSIESCFAPARPLTVSMTKVIVSDTGIDPTHGAFPHHTTTVNIPGWTDTTAMAGSHGSCVAGTAIGVSCSSFAGGVSRGGPYVFFDLSPEGGDPEDLIIAPGFFDVLEESGAHIHTASWGVYSAGQYNTISADFDEEVFEYNRYMVHFFAIGNDGAGVPGDSPGSPAKNVLGWGALTKDGSAVASFTSTGGTADGRKTPIVWLPGQSIRCPYGAQYPPGGSPGHCQTFSVSGTSLTPCQAAGYIQLELEERVIHTGEMQDESLARAIGIAKFYDTVFTGFTPAPLSGDVARGVELPEPRRAWQRCYKTTGEMTLAAAWADPPAVPYSSGSLLFNDLDIWIIHDDGVYKAQHDLAPYERIKFKTLSPFRVLVFAYGNKTFLPPVRFSIFIDNELEEEEDCGDCWPGDISTEGCPEGKSQSCLPTGVFSNCHGCEPGELPDELGQCKCSPLLFVRDSVTQELYQPCPSKRLESRSVRRLEHNQLFELFPYLVVLFFIL